MSVERANNSAPKSPRCPSCAQPMRLIRKTIRFNGLPDLCTFECRACNVSLAEECGAPREITPKPDVGSWYLDEFGNPTREIKRHD
jgi:transposase-like protein